MKKPKKRRKFRVLKFKKIKQLREQDLDSPSTFRLLSKKKIERKQESSSQLKSDRIDEGEK